MAGTIPPWGIFFHKCVSSTRSVGTTPTVRSETLTKGDISPIMAALRRSELQLAYQPIVDLRSHRIKGFEALLRWQHPELGELPPVAFLDAVEHHGLRSVVTSYVIERAARQCEAWRADGLLTTV